MISFDTALATLSGAFPVRGVETVPTSSAAQRVTAEAIASPLDLPRHDQSAMDGYAVRSADLAGAAADSPCELPVAMTCAAGMMPVAALSPGQCARIYTGAVLPDGADSVVAQERVEVAGDYARFDATVTTGRNVRCRGEETKAGDEILRAGQRLNAGQLGLLAHVGVSSLAVYQQPRVVGLITGDEISAQGAANLGDAEIPNSNGPLLAAWCRARGLQPLRIETLPDDAGSIAGQLEAALNDADLVITTGGVSVGDRDYVVRCARELGVEELFWKVAQKPGKPMYAGRSGDTAVIGLPGNPAAVYVGLHLHVAPVLDRMEGQQLETNVLCARLAGPVQPGRDRVNLLRGQAWIDDAGHLCAHVLPDQPSHMLRNLAASNAILRIDPGTGRLEAGEMVRCWLTGSVSPAEPV